MDAAALTAQLGGFWRRSYGTSPCPVCQPERRRDQNALTLANGPRGLLLHCKKAGCSFHQILAAAGITAGAWAMPDLAEIAKREAEERAEVERRAEQARSLWREASPISGTIGETYLRSRGITCVLPSTLRFAPSCWHVSARRLPALVALVEGSGGFAVHRTYLRSDGFGKAKVDPPKAMLGPTSGGAVRLSSAPGRLVVAEGIETGLSLLSGLLGETSTVWAALSTSGLRSLSLPSQPGRLAIALDGDAPGRSAGHALAERAHALGWHVSFLEPPGGCDFNDVLTGRLGQ
ncbi:toprim domain-containing protein [Cereibacter sphaeroides]|uniref:DUF7146 domain-containing protein n=1 Tax=Cereibacter sphaeroides TaxID=1063 RepID=UPI001F326011|nr:toprim domain-containing protein [Cereibacter sphaeroides]MCE6951683.1 toprim domain-containing protein [Cereibacter sphaeroides]